jgi:hypothetical protein
MRPGGRRFPGAPLPGAGSGAGRYDLGKQRELGNLFVTSRIYETSRRPRRHGLERALDLALWLEIYKPALKMS